jgi:Na+-transporting NADH:ubiquinone oxidoreductase subunit C
MNVQSNTYTLIYSSVLVIVVAVGLAFTALKLQPLQEKNIEIEKKQNMLASIGVESTVEDAVEKYGQYIKNSLVINSEGVEIEGVDAFTIDLKAEQKKELTERNLPIFVCQKDNEFYYIIPLRGKGLWGPIWGYIALEEDFNTVYGAYFDHKGETPGLGAEISTSWFQKPFKGKQLFDETETFVSILVLKGGKADLSNPHQVDAVSGGTITSKGLEKMLYDSLLPYEKYFKTNKKTVE